LFVSRRGESVLRRDAAVRRVQPPRLGKSISRDGHVAVIRGGARADTEEMVHAARGVGERLKAVAPPGVDVALTGRLLCGRSSTRRTRRP
jgi:hypothetical protein